MEMQQEENSLKDLEARQKIVPFDPVSTSYGMGWKGLQAVRYRNSPLSEFSAAYTPGTHVLFLYFRPPEKMEVRCEGGEAGHAASRGFNRGGASREFRAVALAGKPRLALHLS